MRGTTFVASVAVEVHMSPIDQLIVILTLITPMGLLAEYTPSIASDLYTQCIQSLVSWMF